MVVDGNDIVVLDEHRNFIEYKSHPLKSHPLTVFLRQYIGFVLAIALSSSACKALFTIWGDL